MAFVFFFMLLGLLLLKPVKNCFSVVSRSFGSGKGWKERERALRAGWINGRMHARMLAYVGVALDLRTSVDSLGSLA